MRRSRQLLFIASLLLAAPVFGAASAYHLELEANPGAPFPWLGRFGSVTVHVYPAGVRADTVWLNGFSPSGARDVTVENPYGRMYTDVPISQLGSLVRKMAPADVLTASEPPVQKPVAGKVHGISANRYRLVYGASAWIDVWTTTALGENRQYRLLADQLVGGISAPTAAAWARIPGMPLYVELNFRRFKKLPLLRVRNVSTDASGQEKAMKTGPLYFRAPMLDALWK